MYARQVLGPAFLHIMILAAGDRLVLEMQYCLSFSSAAGGKICCQKAYCQSEKNCSHRIKRLSVTCRK